jgi:hypothetical protein
MNRSKTKQAVLITPAKFKAGLRRLLSVSKAELDARIQQDREQRRANRKAS